MASPEDNILSPSFLVNSLAGRSVLQTLNEKRKSENPISQDDAWIGTILQHPLIVELYGWLARLLGWLLDVRMGGWAW